MTTEHPSNLPRLMVGRVTHARLAPVKHAFSYATFFLRMPLESLAELPRLGVPLSRWGLLSFHPADHGPCDGSSLLDWAKAQLALFQLDAHCDGSIELCAYPRVLGYAFNPVSFWLCRNQDGTLRAVIAEVRNTFGERHNYVVAHSDGRAIGMNDVITARKVFHVSPFFAVHGVYQFRFDIRADQQTIGIDYASHDSTNPSAAAATVLVTAVSGKACALNTAAVRKTLLAHPLMTVMVVVRIHWQALLLLKKRVRFFSKPDLPLENTTR